MSKIVDPVNLMIDQLTSQVQRNFRELLFSYASLHLGGEKLSNIDDYALLEAMVGININIEPIPIIELKRHKTDFPYFLLDVFHSRLVQAWQDCLNKIFCHYVELHFKGVRPFTEPQRKQVQLDFRAGDELNEQIKLGLIRGFEFDSYAERQKLVDRLLNPNGAQQTHLLNVHKHVQIRNAIQHRNSIVDNIVLHPLGMKQIEVLDEQGTPKNLREGDKISLSIPEYDSFSRSLLIVGQTWRQ